MLNKDQIVEMATHYRYLRDRGLISDLVCFQRILVLNDTFAMNLYGPVGKIYIGLLTALAPSVVKPVDVQIVFTENRYGKEWSPFGRFEHRVVGCTVVFSFYCKHKDLKSIDQTLIYAQCGYEGFEAQAGWDLDNQENLLVHLKFSN